MVGWRAATGVDHISSALTMRDNGNSLFRGGPGFWSGTRIAKSFPVTSCWRTVTSLRLVLKESIYGTEMTFKCH